MAAPWT